MSTQYPSNVHIPSIETAIYLLERAKQQNDMKLLLSALDAIVVALPELKENEQILIKEKLTHYYELTQPIEEKSHWITTLFTNFAIMIKQSPLPTLCTIGFTSIKDNVIQLDHNYNIHQNCMLFIRRLVKEFVQLVWKLETDFKLSEKMSSVAKEGAVLVGKTVVAYQSAENYQVRKRKAKRSVSL